MNGNIYAPIIYHKGRMYLSDPFLSFEQCDSYMQENNLYHLAIINARKKTIEILHYEEKHNEK